MMMIHSERIQQRKHEQVATEESDVMSPDKPCRGLWECEFGAEARGEDIFNTITSSEATAGQRRSVLHECGSSALTFRDLQSLNTETELRL